MTVTKFDIRLLTFVPQSKCSELDFCSSLDIFETCLMFNIRTTISNRLGFVVKTFDSRLKLGDQLLLGAPLLLGNRLMFGSFRVFEDLFRLGGPLVLRSRLLTAKFDLIENECLVWRWAYQSRRTLGSIIELSRRKARGFLSLALRNGVGYSTSMVAYLESWFGRSSYIW